MKYICPYCGQVVSCKWLDMKTQVECENCKKMVFQPVKLKLQILYFITTFMVTMFSYTICSSLELTSWQKVIILLLTGIGVVLITLVIELKICKGVNGIFNTKKYK